MARKRKDAHPNHFASSTIVLQQLEEGGNSTQAEHGEADAGEAGGILAVVAAAVAGITTVATRVGLLVVGSASLLASNLVILLELLEEVAERRDICGGSDRDGTLDGLERGELDPTTVLRSCKLNLVSTVLTWRSYHGE